MIEKLLNPTLTSYPGTPSRILGCAPRAGRGMEFLWLVNAFLVPLIFLGPGLMDVGFDVPKVTLYQSLVGLICALWIIEVSPTFSFFMGRMLRFSPRLIWAWLLAQPSRWVLVAAWMFLASYLISTLLSPSISVSLWGSEPALGGNSFYNNLSHFLLFFVLVTHIKTASQLWRLLGAIVAAGVVIGLYAVIQYYGLDPFGIHVSGRSVVSSLGNPISAGAFLLMVIPVTLAMALKSTGRPASSIRMIWWFIPLMIIVLGMAVTQARDPWVGLVVALFIFLAAVTATVGWAASLRALVLSAAAIAAAWTVLTFIPAQAVSIQLAPRASSAVRDMASALMTESSRNELSSDEADPDSRSSEAFLAIRTPSDPPTSIATRLLLWKDAAQMALHRPWFQREDRPPSIFLYLFGYGPEFFQYVFPLIHPVELSDQNTGGLYYGAAQAHNNTLNRWVEPGVFGLASHLVLLGATAVIGIRFIIDKGNKARVSQLLAMAAVLASLGGRMVEQLAGIPHISDEALFWTVLAVVAALPMIEHGPLHGETSPRRVKPHLEFSSLTFQNSAIKRCGSAWRWSSHRWFWELRLSKTLTMP